MSDERATNRMPAWAAGLTSASAFGDEQARLGGVWTLLGLTTDIPRDQDWLRTTVGGRSVFVQRFGEELRAFENVCMHRYYPLRTGDRGNGVVRCGFHHWQYNAEGLAVGIPKCKEMFGVTPRELDARLTPLEVATCGALIFGRFPGEAGGDSLERWLGDAFPILEAVCTPPRAPRLIHTPIRANWKLPYHISLDDYHIVAVHADTFGKDGYLPADVPRYYRLGAHSAYFYGGDEDGVTRMADECRRGVYRPPAYRIFQLFPNLLVLHVQAGPVWYVIIQQYVPVAPDRCLSRAWFFPLAFTPEDRTPFHALFRRVAAPFVRLAFPLYMRKIFREDNVVCEALQEVAGQIPGDPVLSRHETRIGWFEEAYAAMMGGAGLPPTRS